MRELLTQLFSTIPLEHPPHISWLAHLALLLSLPLLLILGSRAKGDRMVRGFFLVLLLALYGFFIFLDFSWQTSLPFYHCRLAMLFFLFSKDGSKFKQYWAYLGIIGPIVAFIYPILYQYPFFHITNLSFILLHQLLFYLSAAYLYHQDNRIQLSKRSIQIYSFGLTVVMAIVAAGTGGNYGFLLELPILNTSSLWFNSIFMSLLLALGISGVQGLFLYLKDGDNLVEERLF
ncbi:TMEM164-related integral membrane acyltransferase [Streptococcus sp. 10F2]